MQGAPRGLLFTATCVRVHKCTRKHIRQPVLPTQHGCNVCVLIGVCCISARRRKIIVKVKRKVKSVSLCWGFGQPLTVAWWRSAQICSVFVKQVSLYRRPCFCPPNFLTQIVPNSHHTASIQTAAKVAYAFPQCQFVHIQDVPRNGRTGWTIYCGINKKTLTIYAYCLTWSYLCLYIYSMCYRHINILYLIQHQLESKSKNNNFFYIIAN